MFEWNIAYLKAFLCVCVCAISLVMSAIN